jgi:hypothetical protein
MLRAGLPTPLFLLLASMGVQGIVRAADAGALPERLGDTGLYVSGSMTQLQPDVLQFSPQYPLWSDGASKHRWIKLPPGTSIDAAKPDAWDFPRGTKLWKEFSHEGRVETRYIERGADGVWRYASYVWNAGGTDAVLAPPAGIRDLPVPGMRYSIPAQDDCRACHEGAPVPVLGFSALQLSPDRDPNAPHADATNTAKRLDLETLTARGLLKNLPPEILLHPPRVAARNATERAALGYLHGNCGHCHNDDGPLAVLEMSMAQRVATNASPDAVVRSLAGVRSEFRMPGGDARVAPGHPGSSVVARRMQSREPREQMPPLGTAAVDIEAMSLIGQWIESLSVQPSE